MNNSTWKKVGLGCGGCLGLSVFGFVGMITLGILVSENESSGLAATPSPSPTQDTDVVQEIGTSPQEEEVKEEEELAITPEEILGIVLSSGWHELSTQEQDEFCQSWALSSEVMVEAFMEGYGEDPSTEITDDEVRGVVVDFYDDKCL